MTREQAINEIRSWDFLDEKEIEAIHTLIPELAESEDERIRKEMIDFLKSEKAFQTIDLPISERWIAYLEKQKEQKPTIELVFPKFRVGDIIRSVRDKWNKTTRRISHVGEHGYNFDYRHLGDKVSGGSFGFSFEDDYELVEQKPAEWDEYTKTNLDRALQIIKKAKGTLQGYQSDDGIYECDKAIECLEHFLYRGLEIEKPVEWSDYKDKVNVQYCSSEPECSEEDENGMFSDIIMAIRAYYKCEREDLVDYVKSLRPSWKPSEEQMRFLLAVINEPNNAGSESCHLVLKSIYDDLKKLI